MKNLARGQGQSNREHSKAPREKRKMKLPASEASKKFSGSRNQQRKNTASLLFETPWTLKLWIL